VTRCVYFLFADATQKTVFSVNDKGPFDQQQSRGEQSSKVIPIEETMSVEARQVSIPSCRAFDRTLRA